MEYPLWFGPALCLGNARAQIAKQWHKPGQIIQKLWQFDVPVCQGVMRVQALRQVRITLPSVSRRTGGNQGRHRHQLRFPVQFGGRVGNFRSKLKARWRAHGEHLVRGEVSGGVKRRRDAQRP